MDDECEFCNGERMFKGEECFLCDGSGKDNLDD